MPTGNFLCVENYTGARCEEVFLPSFSVQSKSNVPAGVVALAVLVTVAFAALYFLCRRGHLPRSRWSPCEVSLVEADSASTGHLHLKASERQRRLVLISTTAACGVSASMLSAYTKVEHMTDHIVCNKKLLKESQGLEEVIH
ncbi:pro-neuregulin-4, membrane-bound isoform isoform X3 [Dipodomys merriami]|uniref:pro-neuregulin-4, membrane-bound isoform isoform X3 n=1 Tax=Dipodomys merriami TaxID=94247 RepID=UPI003855DC8E